MWKFIKSPVFQISVGLVILTVSILLFADLLGIVPNTRNAELQARKVIAETVAVQLSNELATDHPEIVEEILRSLVERNDNILSSALRQKGGKLFAQMGPHTGQWTLKPKEHSTTSQVQVPIYDDAGLWGTAEIRFTELGVKDSFFSLRDSFPMVILFMAIAGFVAYRFFLKRALHELNPDSVIPERVRTALNTLSEGLIIINTEGRIVFANTSFVERSGWGSGELTGRLIDKLNWILLDESNESEELPWIHVLEGREMPLGVPVTLTTRNLESYKFIVNVTPILTDGQTVRGALITLDDISKIEEMNIELHRTLSKLKLTQEEISHQNEELYLLATRDPLTGLLNRRSLFQGFDVLFEEALRDDEKLSCIMADIDHFKRVNDLYGHIAGDRVIKLLARILTHHSRPNDLVGRFGGEEFCIVLPGVDSETAADIAGRMRSAIQKGEGARYTGRFSITASFGVATLDKSLAIPQDLVERADQALYIAKESGRNQVIEWSEDLVCDSNEEASDPSEPVVQGEGPVILDDDVMEKITNTTVVDEIQVANTALPEQSILPSTGLEKNYGTDIDVTQYATSQVVLYDRIEQAILRANRINNKIGVVVVGVDTVRVVNDTLGSAVGDKLIKLFIRRLKEVLRDTDTVSLSEQKELVFSVSRLASHEVVVLLSDLNKSEIVHAVLTRLLSAYLQPMVLEGYEYNLDVVSGISFYPADGESADTLIRAASSAMHRAEREEIRNQISFYDKEENQRSVDRFHLESDLYKALKNEELLVHYLPKLDLETGEVLGVEALMRWHHPLHGIIAPTEFIPLAEQTGLIMSFGQWFFRTVCRQVQIWRESSNEDLQIAVNLSPVEFRNPRLADDFLEIMAEYQVPAKIMEFEVTEGNSVHHHDNAIKVLEQFSAAGCQIIADDFGSGHSSMSYLLCFPLSKVKIDQNLMIDFHNNYREAAIVSAIVSMVQSLGLRVIAEGVETVDQLHFLQDLQCDEIQGFLIGEPVPASKLAGLLDEAESVKRMILKYRAEQDQNGAHKASVVGSSVISDFPLGKK